MKIYFAGNVTVPRERVLIKRRAHRLYSFFYHGKNREFYEEFKYRIINHHENIFRR